MNIKINEDRKSAQFIGVSILVSVLLLTMMFAAPASPLFAGTIIKDGATVTQGKIVYIDPPKVAAHVDLKPNDPPAIFVNNWYSRGISLAVDRKYIEISWGMISDVNLATRESAAMVLKDTAEDYLAEEKNSAAKFWEVNGGDTIRLNPPQGGSDSHAWNHCYTMAELEAYKREAIRWAHYILDVYLPANFPSL